MRTSLLTMSLATLLAASGCAKHQPETAAAKPATPKPVAAPVANAAADKAPAKAVAKAGAKAGAKHEDGAAPAGEAACGAHGDKKDAPGCPGMPAAAQVGDNPAAAPAAEAAKGAAPEAKVAGKVPGKVYGKGVSDVPVVQVSELLAKADAYVGKRVRVEGLVTDVCPMRGCWFNMAGDKPGTQLRFKVRDGVMVFPLSAKGQYAVAEGVVRKIPLNLEQSKRYMKHQADEKGEKFDPASVTEPITLVRLDGVGAVLRDKK